MEITADEIPDVIEYLTPEEQAEYDVLISCERLRPSLVTYIEKTKRIILDDWQVDLCKRLEKAFWLAQYTKFEFTEVEENGLEYVVSPSDLWILKTEFEEKKGKGTRAAIHAPPQFGKSIIMSQCYPAWILGWDPIHRYRLATYNIFHSARFSVVIKHLMLSPEHLAFFPDPAGHISPKSKAVEWFTNARLEVNDGQASFTALGLQSGFVGTGADTLDEDDPYKSVEEALSEVIRDKAWRFHEETAEPRLGESSNAWIMYHRYHQDDQGGRAIATGRFQLLRYSAQADGDYIDEESGALYPDPLNRTEGEYLSARFSESYYARQKQNEQVWNSQFQGRPTSKTGNLFDVSKIGTIYEMPPLVHEVRAWDNAATEGGGAFTAGVRIGVTGNGRYIVRNVKREQVGTAERKLLQHTTAAEDGKLVQIHGPQDPGSAGKDVAFQFEEELRAEEFNVTTTVVSGSKEMRAYPFSLAVNSGLVDLFDDRSWDIKAFKNELHNFPLSTYKDQVDAGSDGYSHIYRLFHRGLVIKTYKPEISLLNWDVFANKFGAQIPAHWEVDAACLITGDSSKASAWAITARAAENANLGETVFLVASARSFTADQSAMLTSLTAGLRRYCARGVDQVGRIWIAKGQPEVIRLASEKFALQLHEFEQDDNAGIPETNWYFQYLPTTPHPFRNSMGASHCYLLCADGQVDEPSDDSGLLATRQELATWAYNDKGEPQPLGGATLRCLRMTLWSFALSATAMTREERLVAKLPEDLKPAEVLSHMGQTDFVELYMAQQHAMKQIKIAEEKEEKAEQKAWGRISGSPVRHRRR